MTHVVLSPLASSDIDKIAADSLEQFGLAAASKILDEFDRTLKVLARHPDIGRKRNEIVVALRSLPFGPFVIFYRAPNAKLIEVVRILHGSRDLPHVF